MNHEQFGKLSNYPHNLLKKLTTHTFSEDLLHFLLFHFH